MLHRTFLVLSLLLLTTSCWVTESTLSEQIERQNAFIIAQNKNQLASIESMIKDSTSTPQLEQPYTIEQIKTWGVGNYPNNIKVSYITNSAAFGPKREKILSLKESKVLKVIIVPIQPYNPITYSGAFIFDDVHKVAGPPNISPDIRQYLRGKEEVVPNSDYSYINSKLYTDGEIRAYYIALFTLNKDTERLRKNEGIESRTGL